jgi:hypothetical protein
MAFDPKREKSRGLPGAGPLILLVSGIGFLSSYNYDFFACSYSQ